MTYDQLLTLDAIVKYGSFKAASEALHKTQPSLSMAIKKLEEEFNLQLFNREEYRPKLTEQGKAFYKKAQTALEQFSELENLAQGMGSGFEPEIKICIDAIFPIHKINNLLGHFLEPHISTGLNLTADVLEGVYRQVNEEEVDFAIGPNMDIGSDLEKIKILSSKIIPVIGKQHFNQSVGNINYLKSIPQIVLGSSVKEDKEKVSSGLSHQYWYTSDLFMKEQLIESGLGWGRLPEHQVAEKIKQGKLFEIQAIPQVQALEVPMHIIRKKNKRMGPNTKRLWEFLADGREQS